MEILSIESITSFIFTYSFRIVGALLIFLIGKKVARWVATIFTKIIKKSTNDETIISFIESAIYIVFLLVVIFAALANLGIETTSFIAILGALGLAIGMALKDTFSSVGAGLLIVFFKPFQVKDTIYASGVSGTVESINVFSTILKTPDNKIIIIPNSKIIAGNIINESVKKVRRVDITFGIGYEDDLKKAKKILFEIIEQNEKILKSPAPNVVVLELAESSVNLGITAWVKVADYNDVKFALNESVKLTFDKEGIKIPYPQLEVSQKQSNII